MSDNERVILFAGPMGAGKTTAVATLSDIPVITTEALNNDPDRNAKSTTTVALDYGQITLPEGDVVRLYGVPGQERFDFMWRIIEARAMGLVLLLDATAEDPIADMDGFLDKFRDPVRRGAAVVGVTRSDVAGVSGVEKYYARLRERRQFMPVFEIDARDRSQMIAVLSSLVVMVQTHDASMDVA